VSSKVTTPSSHASPANHLTNSAPVSISPVSISQASTSLPHESTSLPSLPSHPTHRLQHTLPILPHSSDHVPQDSLLPVSHNSSIPMDNHEPDIHPTEPVPISNSNIHGMQTHSKNKIHKPKIPTNGTTKYPLPQALTVSLSQTDSEPTSFTNASNHSEWRTAMSEEFTALVKNGTWDLVPYKPSVNVVGCK
jgi:hypothetical protein